LQRSREREHPPAPGLSPEAWDTVRAYPWPANLDELDAVLQSASLRASGRRIEAAHLPAPVRLAVRMDRTPDGEPDRVVPLYQVLEEAERRLIRWALRKAQGNKSKAADLLAMWRPRLLRRMKMLGISEAEPAAGE